MKKNVSRIITAVIILISLTVMSFVIYSMISDSRQIREPDDTGEQASEMPSISPILSNIQKETVVNRGEIDIDIENTDTGRNNEPGIEGDVVIIPGLRE